MAYPPTASLLCFSLWLTIVSCIYATSMNINREAANSKLALEEEPPKPKTWPEQFHSLLVMNNSRTIELQVVDLWYDWPNRRNLNIIQSQLGKKLYDVEHNNGTSYYFTLDENQECRIMHFEVGILPTDWLVNGANYLGQRYMDGFLCNVWEKVDFILYYEDVVTNRPVYWLFLTTGQAFHVMTFEVGVMLEDSKWQAPVYCFDKEDQTLHLDSHPRL